MHNQNQSGVAGRNFITNILQTVVVSFLIIEREYEKNGSPLYRRCYL